MPLRQPLIPTLLSGSPSSKLRIKISEKMCVCTRVCVPVCGCIVVHINMCSSWVYFLIWWLLCWISLLEEWIGHVNQELPGCLDSHFTVWVLLWSAFLSLQFHILMPQPPVGQHLEMGPLGGDRVYRRSWRWDPMIRSVPLQEGTPERLLDLSVTHVRTQGKGCCLQARKSALTRMRPGLAWGGLDLQLPKV